MFKTQEKTNSLIEYNLGKCTLAEGGGLILQRSTVIFSGYPYLKQTPRFYFLSVLGVFFLHSRNPREIKENVISGRREIMKGKGKRKNKRPRVRLLHNLLTLVC